MIIILVKSVSALIRLGSRTMFPWSGSSHPGSTFSVCSSKESYLVILSPLRSASGETSPFLTPHFVVGTFLLLVNLVSNYISPYRQIHISATQRGVSRFGRAFTSSILVTFLIENLGIWTNDALPEVLG